jgi:hypothetical protein
MRHAGGFGAKPWDQSCRQRYGYPLYIDRSVFSNISPDVINVLIVDDREQPSPKIGAGLPEFFFDKRGRVCPAHLPARDCA